MGPASALWAQQEGGRGAQVIDGSSLSLEGTTGTRQGRSPALELLFVGQDVAAQAAGALGLVHVLQERPAIRAQRVRGALAAYASLQVIQPTSVSSAPHTAPSSYRCDDPKHELLTSISERVVQD